MSERGFTLLEVLIGGGVLTAGMLSLLLVSRSLVNDLTPAATAGEMPPAAYPLLERFIDGNIELFKAPAQGTPAGNYTCVIQGATLSAVVSGGTSLIGPATLQATPRLVRYQIEVARTNASGVGTTPVARVHFWRLETITPGAYRGQ
jgi:hypothetical protein